MHDSIIGERLGIPSVGVMTNHFIGAAELMARVLGAERFPFVVIDHPISSATGAELEARAKRAAADAEQILVTRD